MRRQGLAGLALVAVIVLAGCTSGPISVSTNETATPTATPVVPAEIQNATADSYRFSYDATLTNRNGPLNVTADGVVDRSARRLNVTYTYGDPIDRRLAVVAIENATYHRENGTWSERDESVDWDQDPLAHQRAIWAASNTSTVNGSTTNGSTANATNASAFADSEPTIDADDEVVTLSVSNRSAVEGLLRSAPFGLPETVYVDNATYLVTRDRDGPIREVRLRATIIQSNNEGEIDARLTFSDHGAPVSVETPPIAEE
ncbi:hypothetical protein [Halococcoides cellulosivorans]|uniref:LppX_LprAFG lipoprotein n=1 Tax=Halococcoides cellulosivorans TaxID=1679096 RepID=A0A2R4X2U0_9EURY|nr:hypothetical protein [Halococcoides cellulosivorans]AWB28102.1 hypothetical protein HARCEL1_10485 [Halococcoides cellulosivorans]